MFGICQICDEIFAREAFEYPEMDNRTSFLPPGGRLLVAAISSLHISSEGGKHS